jgi:hypothetical protein
MKKSITIALGSLTIATLTIGTLVYQAGSFDDLKLRHFSVTKHFHDQTQELADLRKQNLDPANNTRIELSELLDGGPPKDGIPSIDNPEFDRAKTTPFNQDELVIGVIVNGEAKAYPIGIMNWHEIVNDTVGGTNLTVSYCPLCDTMVAFHRGNTTFGVSGKLYQSCLVMYDRTDDSLYSQPWALGVVGKNVNVSLTRVPTLKTTLGDWLKKYPDSKILATRTGHNRDYFRYPYGTYTENEELIFPVRHQEQRNLHPKAIITYAWEADQKDPHNQFSGISEQFSHQEIKQIGEKIVNFGDRQIRARWHNQLNTVIVEELDGGIIPTSTAFAFVYPAFFGTF